MNTISSAASLIAQQSTSSSAAKSAPSSDFAQAVQSAISTVETSQSNASRAAQDFLVNGKGDVHQVALASQQAELSLELFQQVRNKFVQAYQEVMKMPM